MPCDKFVDKTMRGVLGNTIMSVVAPVFNFEGGSVGIDGRKS
jgi:hypothetical protein